VRKRLLVSAGVILAAAFVAVCAVKYLERNERLAKLARGRLIDGEHYDRIKVGMSRAEVEAVLGGPPGDFTTEDVSYKVPDSDLVIFTEGPYEFWAGNDADIWVAFDERGDVRRRDFGDAVSTPKTPPWLPYLRAWRRCVWP
jgi:hypothetical protein